MVDESLQMLKFDGTGKVDFGRWKTNMLAVAAIKGEFDQAYLNQLSVVANPAAVPPVSQTEADKNKKKNRLGWNYLIVALGVPPLQTVLNSTATNNPRAAWQELISVYEPLTVEAYSQLLQEMEACKLKDEKQRDAISISEESCQILDSQHKA